MVEFAFAFAVLFPLFTGTFEFGYGFFVYNQMKNAVREGARYASLRTYNAPDSAYTEAYGTAVKNIVVYGNPAGGPKPLVPGLTTANVLLTVTFVDRVPAQVTVKIQNYQLSTIFKRFVLSKPECTFPYIGRFAPNGT